MIDRPQVTWIVDRFTDLMFDWIATDDKVMALGVEAVADSLELEYPGLGDSFRDWYDDEG